MLSDCLHACLIVGVRHLVLLYMSSTPPHTLKTLCCRSLTPSPFPVTHTQVPCRRWSSPWATTLLLPTYLVRLCPHPVSSAAQSRCRGRPVHWQGCGAPPVGLQPTMRCVCVSHVCVCVTCVCVTCVCVTCVCVCDMCVWRGGGSAGVGLQLVLSTPVSRASLYCVGPH